MEMWGRPSTFLWNKSKFWECAWLIFGWNIFILLNNSGICFVFDNSIKLETEDFHFFFNFENRFHVNFNYKNLIGYAPLEPLEPLIFGTVHKCLLYRKSIRNILIHTNCVSPVFFFSYVKFTDTRRKDTRLGLTPNNFTFKLFYYSFWNISIQKIK